MKTLTQKSIAAAVFATACAAGLSPALAADELNLYSYRQPFLIKPLIEAFVEKTGTTVSVVYAKNGILERIKAEGENSPADMVLTVDIGRLTDMADAGILDETQSDELEERIPANLRDPKGRWFGLTSRARVLFVSKDRVDPAKTFTYESLADPEFKGKICIRSGKHPYNISLIASMIANNGEEAAEKWLTGLKNNLAHKPQGNDRAQAKGIFAGACDIGIANSYYYGKMVTNDDKPEQKEWANAIRVAFPNQADRGSHVNISGAGILKGSKNKEAALELIEFLTSDEAQEIYAHVNFEYPIVQGLAPDEITESLGKFKIDPINLAEVSKYRAAASKLVDKVGFELGPND